MEHKRKILTNIADTILTNIDVMKTSLGLFSGTFGEIYFLFQYSHIDNKYKEKASILLDDYLEKRLNNYNLHYSYSNGLAGVGVGLYLLAEQGHIELPYDFFDEIYIYLRNMMNSQIEINRYDFLHGAIGMGFYFLKRYKYDPAKSVIPLYELIDFLEKSMIYNPGSDTVKWIKSQSELETISSEDNISLSHGISSIVIFLSRVLQYKIGDDEKNSLMLRRSIKYITSQQIDHNIYNSYFPSASLNFRQGEKRDSRLAWCYGDLGIAYALWYAGQQLNDKLLIKFVEEILIFNAKRTSYDSTWIIDAPICHGSAGVAQMFFRMHKNMQIPEFYKAYEYWTQRTLTYNSHKEGLAGYKTFYAGNSTWYNNTNLLEGIAGIGLSLITPEYSDWDELFLLSFK